MNKQKIEEPLKVFLIVVVLLLIATSVISNTEEKTEAEKAQEERIVDFSKPDDVQQKMGKFGYGVLLEPQNIGNLKSNWDSGPLKDIIPRENIYESEIGRSGSDPFFQQKFVEQNSLGGLDLTKGSPKYGNGLLTNGQQSLNVKDIGLKGATIVSLPGGGFEVDKPTIIAGQEQTFKAPDGSTIDVGKDGGKIKIDKDGNIILDNGAVVTYLNGDKVTANANGVIVAHSAKEIQMTGAATGNFRENKFTNNAGTLRMTFDGNEIYSDDAEIFARDAYYNGKVAKKGNDITIERTAAGKDSTFIDRASGIGIKTNGYPVDIHRNQISQLSKHYTGPPLTDTQLKQQESKVEQAAAEGRGQVWFKYDAESKQLNIYAKGPVSIDSRARGVADNPPPAISNGFSFNSKAKDALLDMQETTANLDIKASGHNLNINYPEQNLNFVSKNADEGTPGASFDYNKKKQTGDLNWNAEGQFNYKDNQNQITTSTDKATINFVRDAVNARDFITGNCPGCSAGTFAEITKTTNIVSGVAGTATIKPADMRIDLAIKDGKVIANIERGKQGDISERLRNTPNAVLSVGNEILVRSADGASYVGINNQGILRFENGQVTDETANILSPTDVNGALGRKVSIISGPESNELNKLFQNRASAQKDYAALANINSQILSQNPALRNYILNTLMIDVNKLNDANYVNKIKEADTKRAKILENLEGTNGAKQWADKLKQNGIEIDENGNIIKGADKLGKGDANDHYYLAYQRKLVEAGIANLEAQKIMANANGISTAEIDKEIVSLKNQIINFDLQKTLIDVNYLAQSGKRGEAIQRYEEFIQQHPGTQSAAIARVSIANLMLEEKVAMNNELNKPKLEEIGKRKASLLRGIETLEAQRMEQKERGEDTSYVESTLQDLIGKLGALRVEESALHSQIRDNLQSPLSEIDRAIAETDDPELKTALEQEAVRLISTAEMEILKLEVLSSKSDPAAAENAKALANNIMINDPSQIPKASVLMAEAYNNIGDYRNAVILLPQIKTDDPEINARIAELNREAQLQLFNQIAAQARERANMEGSEYNELVREEEDGWFGTSINSADILNVFNWLGEDEKKIEIQKTNADLRENTAKGYESVAEIMAKTSRTPAEVLDIVNKGGEDLRNLIRESYGDIPNDELVAKYKNLVLVGGSEMKYTGKVLSGTATREDIAELLYKQGLEDYNFELYGAREAGNLWQQVIQVAPDSEWAKKAREKLEETKIERVQQSGAALFVAELASDPTSILAGAGLVTKMVGVSKYITAGGTALFSVGGEALGLTGKVGEAGKLTKLYEAARGVEIGGGAGKAADWVISKGATGLGWLGKGAEYAGSGLGRINEMTELSSTVRAANNVRRLSKEAEIAFEAKDIMGAAESYNKALEASRTVSSNLRFTQFTGTGDLGKDIAKLVSHSDELVSTAEKSASVLGQGERAREYFTRTRGITPATEEAIAEDTISTISKQTSLEEITFSLDRKPYSFVKASPEEGLVVKSFETGEVRTLGSTELGQLDEGLSFVLRGTTKDETLTTALLAPAKETKIAEEGNALARTTLNVKNDFYGATPTAEEIIVPANTGLTARTETAISNLKSTLAEIKPGKLDEASLAKLDESASKVQSAFRTADDVYSNYGRAPQLGTEKAINELIQKGESSVAIVNVDLTTANKLDRTMQLGDSLLAETTRTLEARFAQLGRGTITRSGTRLKITGVSEDELVRIMPQVQAEVSSGIKNSMILDKNGNIINTAGFDTKLFTGYERIEGTVGMSVEEAQTIVARALERVSGKAEYAEKSLGRGFYSGEVSQEWVGRGYIPENAYGVLPESSYTNGMPARISHDIGRDEQLLADYTEQVAKIKGQGYASAEDLTELSKREKALTTALERRYDQAIRDIRYPGSYKEEYFPEVVDRAIAEQGEQVVTHLEVDGFNAFNSKYLPGSTDQHYHAVLDVVKDTSARYGVDIKMMKKGDEIFFTNPKFKLDGTPWTESDHLALLEDIQKGMAEKFGSMSFQPTAKVTQLDGTVERIPMWKVRNPETGLMETKTFRLGEQPADAIPESATLRFTGVYKGYAGDAITSGDEIPQAVGELANVVNKQKEVEKGIMGSYDELLSYQRGYSRHVDDLTNAEIASLNEKYDLTLERSISGDVVGSSEDAARLEQLGIDVSQRIFKPTGTLGAAQPEMGTMDDMFRAIEQRGFEAGAIEATPAGAWPELGRPLTALDDLHSNPVIMIDDRAVIVSELSDAYKSVDSLGDLTTLEQKGFHLEVDKGIESFLKEKGFSYDGIPAELEQKIASSKGSAMFSLPELLPESSSLNKGDFLKINALEKDGELYITKFSANEKFLESANFDVFADNGLKEKAMSKLLREFNIETPDIELINFDDGYQIIASKYEKGLTNLGKMETEVEKNIEKLISPEAVSMAKEKIMKDAPARLFLEQTDIDYFVRNGKTVSIDNEFGFYSIYQKMGLPPGQRSSPREIVVPFIKKGDFYTNDGVFNEEKFKNLFGDGIKKAEELATTRKDDVNRILIESGFTQTKRDEIIAALDKNSKNLESNLKKLIDGDGVLIPDGKGNLLTQAENMKLAIN